MIKDTDQIISLLEEFLWDIPMLRKYTEQLEQEGIATLPLRSILASMERLKEILDKHLKIPISDEVSQK